MLQLLHPIDQVLGGVVIDAPAPLLGHGCHRGPTHELAEQHPGRVAHRPGIDVLVGAFETGEARGVETGLVGECRGPDIGAARVDRGSQDVGDLLGDRVETG